MTRIEFAKSFGLKRTSLVDIIKELELKGKSKKDIQVQLLKDSIVKSPRVLSDEWRFFENVKQQVGWI